MRANRKHPGKHRQVRKRANSPSDAQFAALLHK